MYLLLLRSVLSIILERWVRIRRARTNTEALFGPVEDMISEDDMAYAYAHLR